VKIWLDSRRQFECRIQVRQHTTPPPYAVGCLYGSLWQYMAVYGTYIHWHFITSHFMTRENFLPAIRARLLTERYPPPTPACVSCCSPLAANEAAPPLCLKCASHQLIATGGDGQCQKPLFGSSLLSLAVALSSIITTISIQAAVPHFACGNIPRVGQNRTYIRIYGIFSRGITGNTAVYSVHLRFWPTLNIPKKTCILPYFILACWSTSYRHTGQLSSTLNLATHVTAHPPVPTSPASLKHILPAHGAAVPHFKSCNTCSSAPPCPYSPCITESILPAHGAAVPHSEICSTPLANAGMHGQPVLQEWKTVGASGVKSAL